MDSKIISPCLSVCRTDPISGYCYGCGRTDEDKKNWKNTETSNEWKVNNLKELEGRLSSWQLEAFKKSYEYKKLHGISLLKKKLLDSKKNNDSSS